jgi:hypothetical protein
MDAAVNGVAAQLRSPNQHLAAKFRGRINENDHGDHQAIQA